MKEHSTKKIFKKVKNVKILFDWIYSRRVRGRVGRDRAIKDLESSTLL